MKYVGQTRCHDIQTRWKYHKTCKENSIGRVLINAYKKYGVDNFKFQIICICFNEDCDKYEIEYINKFNTLTPSGYNIKTGGSYYKHHEETKQIMSEKIKAIWTPEHRENIKNKLKEYYKNNKKHIDSTYRNKISNGMKEYWNNLTMEAKNEIISKRNYKDRKNNTKYVNNLPSNRRKVGKYTVDNNLIERYESITDAAIKHNISHSTIYRVCQNKKSCKTAAGFIWKYI